MGLFSCSIAFQQWSARWFARKLVSILKLSGFQWQKQLHSQRVSLFVSSVVLSLLLSIIPLVLVGTCLLAFCTKGVLSLCTYLWKITHIHFCHVFPVSTSVWIFCVFCGRVLLNISWWWFFQVWSLIVKWVCSSLLSFSRLLFPLMVSQTRLERILRCSQLYLASDVEKPYVLCLIITVVQWHTVLSGLLHKIHLTVFLKRVFLVANKCSENGVVEKWLRLPGWLVHWLWCFKEEGTQLERDYEKLPQHPWTSGNRCSSLCVCYHSVQDMTIGFFSVRFCLPVLGLYEACYQRREKALDDLGMFKGATVIIFYCHRDWAQAAGECFFGSFFNGSWGVAFEDDAILYRSSVISAFAWDLTHCFKEALLNS